jgi:hypothetical protein
MKKTMLYLSLIGLIIPLCSIIVPACVPCKNSADVKFKRLLLTVEAITLVVVYIVIIGALSVAFNQSGGDTEALGAAMDKIIWLMILRPVSIIAIFAALWKKASN